MSMCHGRRYGGKGKRYGGKGKRYGGKGSMRGPAHRPPRSTPAEGLRLRPPPPFFIGGGGASAT